MIAKRWRLAILLAVGLGVLLLLAVASRWLLEAFTPAGGPAVSAEEEPVVCYGLVDLEHGSTMLSPLQPGRVARILVHENEKVSAGTPLLVLEEETAQARLAEARAAADAAEAQRDELRNAPERHRLLLAQQEAVCSALESKLAAARLVVARKKDLGQSNLLDAREVAVAEESAREVAAMLRAEQQKLAELRLRNPERDVRRAEAELAAARARVKQADRILAECTLTAPQAGTVAQVRVTPGDVIGPGQQQPCVLFFPGEPRIVRAEVEQQYAGRVAVGQSVRVQDEFGGAVIGTGHIVRLSDWYLPRRTLSLDPTRPTAGRTLECLVTLDPGHAPVRIGQRVRVTATPREENRRSALEHQGRQEPAVRPQSSFDDFRSSRGGTSNSSRT
jgi:multidrug resistance efflux pump